MSGGVNDGTRVILAGLKELDRTSVTRRKGVVTATDPLSVALGGSDTEYAGVYALASAAPLAVDDVVSCLVVGPDLLVLGRITSSGIIEDWHTVGSGSEPAFQNSWVNFSVPTYTPASFRKTPDGMIHVRGLVTGGSNNTTIFTLPTGYRPAHEMSFSKADGGTGTRDVRVQTTGAVKPVTGTGGVFLDAISFFTD